MGFDKGSQTRSVSNKEKEIFPLECCLCRVGNKLTTTSDFDCAFFPHLAMYIEIPQRCYFHTPIF